jgi:precorrin-2/cobalt-factor-2 C20-methyltransferase
MTRDPDELSDAWLAAAEPVSAALEAGRTAAFVTLGDPGVYSTWTYLRRAVLALRPGTIIETVPGVMALNAAAARIGLPLTEGDETLALVPLPPRAAELDAYLGLFDTLVVYKIGARLGELSDWVRKCGLEKGAYLAAGVGLDREDCGSLFRSRGTADGYLSLAIITDGAEAAVKVAFIGAGPETRS